jgi:hypothetical protein
MSRRERYVDGVQVWVGVVVCEAKRIVVEEPVTESEGLVFDMVYVNFESQLIHVVEKRGTTYTTKRPTAHPHFYTEIASMPQ